ncbi:CZB domain-containing protein [Sulfurimonas paralvinellae]|uniref:Chemoreceptor zinc-binding domain-containing protein n=1 Tax=Sulfurimonas paralvinellae TaxID=317658 RepID=A0A7M1B5M4_9BACT|nr:CZB domain-containing protein [Sulfurimonas paralvinellae]QOP45037.1 hypothetical protein FM071_01480 [Sulfurimonas paralvinellae]
MNKEQTLESVKKAREAHLLQMDKINAIINEEKVDNPTAVSKKECDFGRWIYDENSNVKQLIGSQFYEKLDNKHEQWHTEYFKIYSIFFNPKKKKGFLSKVLGSSGVDPLEKDKAKLYYTELKQTTEELLKALASAERRLEALPESKFK